METSIQVGNGKTFDGWKLIVTTGGDTVTHPISAKVADALIKSGVPSEG